MKKTSKNWTGQKFFFSTSLWVQKLTHENHYLYQQIEVMFPALLFANVTVINNEKIWNDSQGFVMTTVSSSIWINVLLSHFLEFITKFTNPEKPLKKPTTKRIWEQFLLLTPFWSNCWCCCDLSFKNLNHLKILNRLFVYILSFLKNFCFFIIWNPRQNTLSNSDWLEDIQNRFSKFISFTRTTVILVAPILFLPARPGYQICWSWYLYLQ